MVIKEIKEKEVWENILSSFEEKTFLQSWNWGEFQKLLGNKIWRLVVFERENPIAIFFFHKVSAKRGTFLLLPHGPLLKEKEPERAKRIISLILERMKTVGEEERAVFLRFSPLFQREEKMRRIFQELGFLKAPIHVHPELTWELDLENSEEKILMNMRKTTRYLIRKGEKDKEIEIIKSLELNDLNLFNQLYQSTVQRQHFVPFSLSYLKGEFSTFAKDNEILLLLGKYKGEVVSGGIFVFWQKNVFYHHGASSLKYPKIPVSYLLIWEAIKEGKKRECELFNFWGIAPEGKKNHPWQGLTLFKKGFGGYRKEYLKTMDYPLSKRYWFDFLVETIRRKKRGF